MGGRCGSGIPVEEEEEPKERQGNDEQRRRPSVHNNKTEYGEGRRETETVASTLVATDDSGEEGEQQGTIVFLIAPVIPFPNNEMDAVNKDDNVDDDGNLIINNQCRDDDDKNNTIQHNIDLTGIFSVAHEKSLPNVIY